MSRVFHIGIPKSGTTSIQAILGEDERVELLRSTFYTTSRYWTAKDKEKVSDKIYIESNETLVTSGYNKVKLNEVFRRISQLHKDAKIIITIRRQEDAILSMFKYHIKHNFKGVKSLENWMYKTNLGMDYLSTCMYGNLAKLLLLYFKKDNIHFICFEDLKYQPELFYNQFYNVLNIPYKSETNSVVRNSVNLSDNQLYTLSRLNTLSFTSINSEQYNSFKYIRKIERKIKHKIVKAKSLKKPNSFFEINNVNGFQNLKEDYRRSNRMLIELGLIKESKLKEYNYYI